MMTETPLQKTILVIDDELLFLTTCRRYFEREGFQVWAEPNALGALDRLVKSPQEIDVILLDYCLPDLTGTECLSKILDIRPDIPVILLSAYPPESFDPKSVFGAHLVLTKPIELSALVSIIRQIFID